jgi:tripartite-type tricarboxylate transporter receptor subunit TctC
MTTLNHIETPSLGRRIIGRVTLGLAVCRPLAAGAQEFFPGSRPVAIVVGFAPGGSTDIIARLLTQHFSAFLPGTVVVDNRAGAAGTLASGFVARAQPDGHSLLFAGSGVYAMARHLYPQRGYDEETGFAPVGLVATTPIILCASPRSGIRDLPGLVSRAKAQPGRLTYSSSGSGSSAHLAMELFLERAGIAVEHASYRGGAPAVQALITGEVDLSFVDAVSALPLMASRQIVALGISSAERSPIAPEVPTVAESGYPGFEANGNWALLAPVGTPEPTITRLHAALAAAMTDPTIVERLRSLAITPRVTAPEGFRALLAAESAKWGEVIRTRNIRAE